MKREFFRTRTLSLILAAFLFVALFIPMGDAAFAKSETYCDDGIQLYADDVEKETIYFSTKSTESYYINTSFPFYYNGNSDIQNACACVAGANILGYYDRYYDNLIPDYTAGFTRNGNYVYYAMSLQSAKKQSVINELYTLMRTNVDAPGTTQNEFKQGLSSYVSGKSRTVSFTSILNRGSFDMGKFDSALRSGNVVTLYLTGFNWTTIVDYDNEARISQKIYHSNHIAVAYGYDIVSYFDANGNLIKKNTYIAVSTGMVLNESSYFMLNGNGAIEDAESTRIS